MTEVLRVPVLSCDGKWLSPTSPSAARKMLRDGVAQKRIANGVFYVHMTREVGAAVPHDSTVQSLAQHGSTVKNASLRKKIVGVAAVAAVAGLAAASAADSDFSDIVTKIQGWTDGSLGKVLALAIFVVGIAAGVVQQSLMAAVSGVAGAMIVHYGPNIIINVFGGLI